MRSSGSRRRGSAAAMSECRLCPRECGRDRRSEPGLCGAGELPRIAKTMLHNWEEPFISGSRGSGAVFFSGCNMFCSFCQNYLISRSSAGEPVTAGGLAGVMLALQAQGAHNVDLVSPSPYSAVIAAAVPQARERGLAVPIVYNTNAYEKTEALGALDGLVNVYLPDMKYASARAAARFSSTPDYFEFASAAVLEMRRQQPEDVFDADGLMTRGLAVRHLVLPGAVDETRRVLSWLMDNLGQDVRLSLMGQYTPAYRAEGALARKLTRGEYSRAVDYSIRLGFKNVLIQTAGAADPAYTPEFERENE